jgi:hypothetical protein
VLVPIRHDVGVTQSEYLTAEADRTWAFGYPTPTDGSHGERAYWMDASTIKWPRRLVEAWNRWPIGPDELRRVRELLE